jgi:cytochrome c oxidase cbb3-type subunit II
MSDEKKGNYFYRLEWSAILSVFWIIVLFSTSVAVVLIAPRHLDSSWTQPTSSYQVQMYEYVDPNFYISSAPQSSQELQHVYHLKDGFTVLGFFETELFKIISPPELQKFINKPENQNTVLTPKLLMLRSPTEKFIAEAKEHREKLQKEWEEKNPDWLKEGKVKPDYEIWELFVPEGKESFALAPPDGVIENWIDKDYEIIDGTTQHPHLNHDGIIYVNNPREYRITHYTFGTEEGWRYDPKGQKIENLDELKGHQLGFKSRQELIKLGEHIYAIEGCWYCHTDQTRTLVQDVVLNGSDSYPAPPSSANEYIYQEITFPGTRRIGPDMSRVGIKRPSRDWHKAHFWSPKTASQGSIMPSFRHFFDFDPRGTSSALPGIPNYRFEAIFQYLMTKGTRITPPSEAWWLGKDPVRTKEIIEGQRVLK